MASSFSTHVSSINRIPRIVCVTSQLGPLEIPGGPPPFAIAGECDTHNQSINQSRSTEKKNLASTAMHDMT